MFLCMHEFIYSFSNKRNIQMLKLDWIEMLHGVWALNLEIEKLISSNIDFFFQATHYLKMSAYLSIQSRFCGFIWVLWSFSESFVAVVLWGYFNLHLQSQRRCCFVSFFQAAGGVHPGSEWNKTPPQWQTEPAGQNEPADGRIAKKPPGQNKGGRRDPTAGESSFWPDIIPLNKGLLKFMSLMCV